MGRACIGPLYPLSSPPWQLASGCSTHRASDGTAHPIALPLHRDLVVEHTLDDHIIRPQERGWRCETRNAGRRMGAKQREACIRRSSPCAFGFNLGTWYHVCGAMHNYYAYVNSTPCEHVHSRVLPLHTFARKIAAHLSK